MFAPSGAKKPSAKTTLGPFVSIHGDGTGGTLIRPQIFQMDKRNKGCVHGPSWTPYSDLETAQGKLCTYLQCCWPMNAATFG